jgi:hypothetical protein
LIISVRRAFSAMLPDIEREIATTSGLWAKIQVVMFYSAQVEGTLGDDLVTSLLADASRDDMRYPELSGERP